MNIKTAPNINYLWAMLLMEELFRNGVEAVFLSPGSRSSALALALAHHPRLKNIVHFDERGTGFAALGFAAAHRKPVGVITTSGTAVGNLYPAVIEASKKKLPLIIITADRPPELRHTGAHQTIDQVNFFGKYTQWNFDLPCPTLKIAPSFVLTTVDQAIHQSKNGPVHLNFMFREPLSPLKQHDKLGAYIKPLAKWLSSPKPYTHYQQAEQTLTSGNISSIIERIKEFRQGIIVVGKLSSNAERQRILKLAEKLNWPIFPDISSGLRLGVNHPHVISYYDQLLLSPKLSKTCAPDCVLHLGGRITSKRWYQFIEKYPLQEYIMILNHPLRNDPLHNVTVRVQAKIDVFCAALCANLKTSPSKTLLSRLQKANQAMDQTLTQNLENTHVLTEAAVARSISRHIPKDTALFLSNSLPIREIDMYSTPQGPQTRVEGNRGASGIDGIIATACGFSYGLKKRATLVIGDLAFLHDLNSLALFKKLPHPMTIVVLNNDGGGIFSFLPIANQQVETKNFEKYFGMPHGLNFMEAAKLFRLKYATPRSLGEFTHAYQDSFKSNQSTLIELITQRTDNTRLAARITKLIQKAI
jgi:2-succinyl-5-enolpyruvyl-6-hydroxy-3-cyclohexene-1-carboxylate synthase